MTLAHLWRIAALTVIGWFVQGLLELSLQYPLRLAVLIGLLVFVRIIWGRWRKAPSRKAVVQFSSSGLVACLLVSVLIQPLGMPMFYIPSESMTPALQPGDRILVSRVVYWVDPPKRGDLVVFEAPTYGLPPGEPRPTWVKRLIGMPGDKIVIRREKGVYVNGNVLREPPGVPPPDRDWPTDMLGNATGSPYQVPPGCYFVLGDNRNRSNDSRLWLDLRTGLARPELPADHVLGKAIAVFWPRQRAHVIRDTAQVYVSNPSETSAAVHATDE